jgi:hypothetical protein
VSGGEQLLALRLRGREGSTEPATPTETESRYDKAAEDAFNGIQGAITPVDI